MPRPEVRPAAPNPWPASLRTSPHGFEVGGVRATDLADRLGTPLLVFDEDDVVARMRNVRSLFPRVVYALKAFTSHAMIRLALREGLDLLCASGGEVEACLRAGAPPARIQLHGNAKTNDELAAAVEAGLGLVIVDHLEELTRLRAIASDAGRTQPVALRVVPDVVVETHEKIATGHASSKFGMTPPQVVEAARTLDPGDPLRLDGLQAHAGSQVLDVAPFVRVLDVLVDLTAEIGDATGTAPRLLDVGGGFGVTYRDERPLSMDDLAEALLTRLADACAERDLPVPGLQVEPGRSLVANAGLTLYTVVARKRAGGLTILAVDGGMGDNPRPILYDAWHAIAPAGPVPPSDGATMTVVGRHCESGDVIAEDVVLPEVLRPGSLLAVAATGAYAYPLASNYNRFGRPAVVAVSRGRTTPWLRRETAEDMDRLEVTEGSAQGY